MFKEMVERNPSMQQVYYVFVSECQTFVDDIITASSYYSIHYKQIFDSKQTRLTPFVQWAFHPSLIVIVIIIIVVLCPLLLSSSLLLLFVCCSKEFINIKIHHRFSSGAILYCIVLQTRLFYNCPVVASITCSVCGTKARVNDSVHVYVQCNRWCFFLPTQQTCRKVW